MNKKKVFRTTKNGRHEDFFGLWIHWNEFFLCVSDGCLLGGRDGAELGADVAADGQLSAPLVVDDGASDGEETGRRHHGHEQRQEHGVLASSLFGQFPSGGS